MYTLFVWASNEEPGGYGVCPTEEFSYNYGGLLLNGWYAHPESKLGNFTTKQELIDLLIKHNPFRFSDVDRLNSEVDQFVKYYNIK